MRMFAAVLCGAAALAVIAVPVPRAVADNPLCDATKCTFVSPNGSINCTVTLGAPGSPDGAFCAWSDSERAQTVRLLPNGGLDPCINPAVDLIDRCKAQPLKSPAVLGYGQTAVLGPFTCLAEAQGISCTAAPTGRGFTITSVGILPVVPPPPPPPPSDAPLPPAGEGLPPMEVPPPLEFPVP